MAYGNYAPFYRGGFFNPMQTPTMPQMTENQGQFVPQYQSPVQPTQMSVATAQPTNDMIWVLGQTEAESYPVAPNNSVVLWDKNNPTIYIKSVNAQGMPSMRILDFTERNINTSNSQENAPKTHECTCGYKFATKEQINALEGKINDILAMYEELKDKQTTKTTKPTKKEVE